MDTLPNELKFNIIENLDIRDILNLCQTNVTFDNFCQDPNFWHYLLKRDFGDDYRYAGIDPFRLYVAFLIRKISETIREIIWILWTAPVRGETEERLFKISLDKLTMLDNDFIGQIINGNKHIDHVLDALSVATYSKDRLMESYEIVRNSQT